MPSRAPSAVLSLLLASFLDHGLLAAAHAESSPPRAPQEQSRSFDLGPLRIDRIFHSMDGPYARTQLDFHDMDWITGFRAEVVDARSGTKLPDEFFCHSQMQLGNDTRLLVTATGIPAIRFPDGFGIPLKRILGGMPTPWRGVTLFGMVLNNWTPKIDREVDVRLTVDYLRFPGGDVPPKYKKLYKVGLPMTVQSPSEAAKEGAHDEAACSMATKAETVAGLSQHWLVPPGRQTTTKEFEGIVPVPSSVHTALVHLHNYGVSMKLIDLTARKVLWETKVVNEPGRAQIREIPTYSSRVGFMVYPDHRYRIEATYDNTTKKPVDAMAMMYLFYHPLGNEDISYPDPPPDHVN